MSAAVNENLQPQSDNKQLKLLIVDDDPDILESLKDVLELECEDYHIETAHNIASADRIAAIFKPDIALLDIKLGAESGLDLIQVLKGHVPDIACIMMTAYREMEYAVEAVKCGADDFLYKPLEALSLVKTLKRFQLNLLLLRGKVEAERRFRAVFEQSFQFLFVLDESGIIQEINSTALTFTQLDKYHLIGTAFNQAPWWKDRDAVGQAIMQAMQGDVVRRELIIIDNNKEHIFEFTFKPIKDSAGRLAIIIPEGRDISAHKEYEDNIVTLNQSLESRVIERTQQLNQAKFDADSANKAKSEFLSQMSHELRTPLNAIIGFSQILTMSDDNNLSDTQIDHIKHIEDAGKHLLSLINQTLDLSQIEAGEIELYFVDTNINTVLKHTLTILEPLFKTKSISLNNHLAEKTFKEIKVDEQSLTQILINLITNAIKYNSDNGYINIFGEEIDDKFLRVSIQDTGQGVPDYLTDTIFEPFTRAKNVASIEGSGVGLSLCKKLITLMHGKIDFTSTESKGSTFWIDIPLKDS